MKLDYKIHYIGNPTNLKRFINKHDIDEECIKKVSYYTVMVSPKVFQRKFNLKGVIPGKSVIVLENKFVLSIIEASNIKSEGVLIIKEDNFCVNLDKDHMAILDPDIIIKDVISRFDLLDIPE